MSAVTHPERHRGGQPHRLAGEVPPRLLPGGIGVQREDECTDVSALDPPPALHVEDRHDPGYASSQQHQGITGTFAHPQRPGAFVQRGGVYVWSMPFIHCQAGLGESHTFVEGHAAIQRTVAALQRSLRDAPHRRRRSLVDRQCL